MADHKLTVEDLLRSPALQLRLIAGEAGLGRSVSWAHVSELDDPTPWLLGAEVIMTTGIGVPRSAARQRAYLERLDDAGVSALALSAQLHVPPLHRAFLDAAEERGMPVLEVPLAVPFIAVAQEVAASVHGDHRLSAQLQVFGALRWLAAEDLSAADLFKRLERLSGYSVFLCTPYGGPLLPGVPAPSDISVIPDLPDAPPTIPGGFVLPVPAPGGPAGFVVAFEREGARPAGLAVVQHIATVAALQVAMARHSRETLRREGAETLSELLQDLLDPPAARRRLARLGLPLDTPLVLLVLRGTPDDRLLDGYPHLMLRRGNDHVLLGPPTLTTALTPPHAETPDDLPSPAQIPAAGPPPSGTPVGTPSPAGPPDSGLSPAGTWGGGSSPAGLSGLHAGMSRPFLPGESLRVAQREAIWAADRAVEAGRTLVIYGDDPTGRWLPDDPATLRALVDHVLGPILEYDASHNTHLLISARTWMERDRHTDEAAAALHIHPNTLAYRLRRFATLTGRDLTSTTAFAEVWLALRAATQLGLPLT